MNQPFPLTDLQQAYLVGSTSLVELGGLRPNFYVELDAAGLDPKRAEHAVNLLVAQHDQLRTEILPDGTARVLDPAGLPPVRVPVADLCGLPPADQEAALARTRARLADEGVAPTGWPLFAAAISVLRPNRARLHLAMSLLLLDGRSIRQVWDEWLALYADPGTALATTMATFQERVRAMLDTPAVEHWRYWEARLDTLPEGPRLPLTRPLGSIDPVRFTRRTCHLTGAEWARLGARVRRRKLLPAIAMLHVFAEVLRGWAAGPRFCLNVLHQGWYTGDPEAAGVVGQFGATLPLEIGGDGDFWTRAERTQRQFWQDFEHSRVSGVTITRKAAARRGAAPNAALPYVFTSMLHPRHERPGPARPAFRTVRSGLRTPQVLIDNQLVDAEDGGVDCVWDVVDDAFPAGLPELMFAAYQDLVRRLAGPDEPATAPEPLPMAHRIRVEQVNDTIGVVPEGRLEDGFLRQVRLRPDAIAVRSPTRTLTYARLAAASAAVAGWLRDHDIGATDVVPVVMSKGWEQVVAVLGVLRAGAAYCPIDAGLPAERIRALLADLSARVALGQSASPVEAAPITFLPVDRWETVDTRTPPDRSGAATDLAYVIHTSGSTGRPKGVMIEHRSAVNTVSDVNERIGLGPDDRVFGLSSLSFDLSVWDIFGALAAGATLVLPSGTSWPDPIGWAVTAAAAGVTVWNSVPALAEMLLEVAGQRPEIAGTPIRAFLLSGDWISASLPDRAWAAWPDATIIAMGGATEASIWSNGYRVERVDPSWPSIPYGTPLRNQTMRVLDDRLEIRPPWAEGEIHIGGLGLARGYWRDPERTAERFVTHPHTGERLYRTGDLGRYWPDGTIEFLGRVDRQAKIQGFRVEPGEVEAAIRRHPAVRDCVVAVQATGAGQRRLVALAAPRDGARPRGAEIVAHLRALLPHYMVPAQVEVVPGLPLTRNGKVDTAAALALLTADAPAGTAPADGRDGPLVRRVCELWAELLGLATVDPDADFFGLGGTSLIALRMVHRLRAEWGVDLQFGHVFLARTARALAERLSGADRPDGCVVELADGRGDGLILFHPVGGSVTAYLELAQRWPGPVHAVQSPALTRPDSGPGRALRTMAADYRAELARLRPAEPVVLAGWSMGGVLAHEIGRELTGEGVDCRVVMIDSEVPGSAAPPPSSAAAHLDFLRDLAGGRLPAAVADELPRASEVDFAGRARELAVAHGMLPAATDERGYRRLAAVHAGNSAALAGYRAAPSPAPTLLFTASVPDRRDPVGEWRKLCSRIEVERLPGDHYSLLTGDNLAAIVARAGRWVRATR